MTTAFDISPTTRITTRTAKIGRPSKAETLSKFIKEYIYKVSQVVVESRTIPQQQQSISKLDESWNDVTKQQSTNPNNLNNNNNTSNATKSNNNSLSSQWFRVDMIDSEWLQKHMCDDCNIDNWDPQTSSFSLTIDISLSAEKLDHHVLLERWKLNFKNDLTAMDTFKNEFKDPSLIYKRMTIQLRSILCYLRLLPTHQLVQSWESIVNFQIKNINVSSNDNDNDNDRKEKIKKRKANRRFVLLFENGVVVEKH